MALINYATREINAKIVYYGPGLSGKTTNIQYVFKKVRPDNKGRLVSLATQGDRTLFFDFLPVELGNIKGFKTRFHLYTVPGQVFYNSTRKMVLKGSDGVVFVADSQKMMMDENLQSLENLRANLRDMGVDFDGFPMVLQYNKRDLQNAAPVKVINERLNPRGLPYFEASAISGDGVLKTLTAIVKYVLHDLKETPDMHSLDFGAIEEAAGAVVGGASGTLREDGAKPQARRVPATARVAEAADTRPDITEPIRVDAAGRRAGKSPTEQTHGAGDKAYSPGADMELPEAVPQLSGVPETAEDNKVYDEAEMVEGLGTMIAEAEKIPPREASGDPYGLDELHREVPETTSGKKPEVPPDVLVAEEEETGMPDEFHPEMELTSGLDLPSPDVYPAVGEAQETMPAAPMAGRRSRGLRV